MKLFSLIVLTMMLFILNQKVMAKQDNLPPVIDAYITVLDPQHLNSVRVNIANSYDPDGKIKKTRMMLSAPGVPAVDNENDHIFTVPVPPYSIPPTYTVTIIVWDDKNAQTVYSKNVSLNSDYKLNDMLTNSAFSEGNLSESKKYSFAVAGDQIDKNFKITFTRISQTNMAQDLLILFLNLINVQTSLNTFSGNILLNDINLFATNEINFNTVKAEKFVNLKQQNKLVGNWNLPTNSQISVEIHEVQFIPDVTPPVITSDFVSGQVTNNKFFTSNIFDDSRTFTFGMQNGFLGQTYSTQMNIVLIEGINNFIFYSYDSFGNRSADYVLNNIVLDTIAPQLTSIFPLADSIVYANVLPAVKALSLEYNEALSSVKVNSVPAILDNSGKNASIDLAFSQAGIKQLQIQASDIAGNLTQSNSFLNVVFVDRPPILAINVPEGLRINSGSYSFSVVVNSPVPVSTRTFVNGSEVSLTDSKSYSDTVSLEEGNNIIKVVSTDAAGNVSAPTEFSIFVDSQPPQLTNSSPMDSQVFYTNHLPISIPITAVFNEVIGSATINNGVALITGPNSLSGEIQASMAGPIQLQIAVTDLAGNTTTIAKTVTVDFSASAPLVSFDDSIKELLTNKISVPVFGASNKFLSSIKLNGLPLSISANGVDFAGFFNASANGRYQLTLEGTDRWGNIGIATTSIRVLDSLPDGLLNPKAPGLVYDDATHTYIPDFGNLFAAPQGGDFCAVLDSIFSGEIEFKDHLEELEAGLESINYTSSELGIKSIKVPKKRDLENFMGDVEEKLNYIKAPYLLICKGINIIPDSDCPTNRSLFRLVMGEYPEPLIIKSLPIPISVQNFLIPRTNICKDFDSSNLTCKELIEFMPLIADIVLPSAGQVLGSPIGQAVAGYLLCKEQCDKLEIASIPGACNEIAIPDIPTITPFPTPIAMPPRFGETPGFNDWSGGGGGWPDLGGSCGVWYWPCPDGDGGSGAGDGNFLCSIYPSFYFCGTNGLDTRESIVIDVNGIDCSSLVSGTFGSIFDLASSRGVSLSIEFASYVAKCLKTPIVGFPKVKKPIITLTSPVQNQVVADFVHVTGYVDDLYAQVKVEGQIVSTIRSSLGAYFDLSIPVPSDGKVNVEAVDLFGNLATPIEVILVLPNLVPSGVTDVALGVSGQTHMCAIKTGEAYCWGYNYSGETGRPAGEINFEPNYVVLPAGFATDISVGGRYSCVLNNLGDVYCWGINTAGQLGNGNNISTNIPTKVSALSEKVKMISSGGGSHLCAILVSGKVECWGDNSYGKANPISLGNRIAISIFAAANTSCAVLENKDLHCWGQDITLGLGSGSTSDITLTDVDQFAAFLPLCAVRNGGVLCWADIYGTSNATNYTLSGHFISDFQYFPTPIIPEASGARLISAGWGTTCVVIGTSQIKCWGSGISGEGSVFIDTHSVRDVEWLLGPISKIETKRQRACVISEGNLYCWGAGFNSAGDDQKKLIQMSH